MKSGDSIAHGPNWILVWTISMALYVSIVVNAKLQADRPLGFLFLVGIPAASGAAVIIWAVKDWLQSRQSN